MKIGGNKLVNLIALSAVVGVVVGTCGLGLSVYNTWRQRVRGPEFVISEAWVYLPRREPPLRVIALFQNIGDRMGYIRVEAARVILVDNRSFVAEFPTEWRRLFKADTQREQVFTFKEITGDIVLKGSVFKVEGVYSSHKGGVCELEIPEIKITGKIEPIPMDST